MLHVVVAVEISTWAWEISWRHYLSFCSCSCLHSQRYLPTSFCHAGRYQNPSHFAFPSFEWGQSPVVSSPILLLHCKDFFCWRSVSCKHKITNIHKSYLHLDLCILTTAKSFYFGYCCCQLAFPLTLGVLLQRWFSCHATSPFSLLSLHPPWMPSFFFKLSISVPFHL